ncbi:hypothetical protein F5880DRAFT_1591069 [Lentinula raphanica]|nr:hypothetical protein F5880DRAFT_1591069 [Lentinula raphanica]
MVLLASICLSLQSDVICNRCGPIHLHSRIRTSQKGRMYGIKVGTMICYYLVLCMCYEVLFVCNQVPPHLNL